LTLTAVPGLAVGHFTHPQRPTGCSVVLCPPGTVCGVDVRGGAPGSRETELLRPEATVAEVHAVMLTGGSAFGLDAATGVMRWLEEQGRGLAVGPARVPIVPAAVLFDLWLGDARIRPDAAAGYAACAAAHRGPVPQGPVGAGAGARVGKLLGIAQSQPGGLGSVALQAGDLIVAAMVAVNAIGDVLGEDGRILAGALRADGQGFADSQHLLMDRGLSLRSAPTNDAVAGSATTIGIVATNALLTKAQASKLAQLAQHGLSRAVSPITIHDGDTLFALATGEHKATPDLSQLGALAAQAVAQAIRSAVRHAAGVAAVANHE
jgi:L-aminopeptidase/D-esterase-like protein